MKRWIKWIIVLLVVAGVVLAVGRALSARKARQDALVTADAAKAAVVAELAAGDVVRARMREMQQGVAVSGALRAAYSAVVKARVAGELQGLSVREGDAVKAGQVLARIDPTEAKARLEQARRQADAARAQIDIAQRQFDNNKALVEQGFISKTALDTSIASLASARATHEAAVAAADVARKSLDDTVLIAPLSGLVAQRLAQPGERMPVDGRVVEIVDLSRLEVDVALSPADAAAVRIGQEARLTVEGLAAPVTARVARINPSAQAGSRGIVVYLTLPGQPGLRQGLFVQGTLGTGAASALAVPVSAVRTDKPQPYVQVVADGRIAHRTVVPGARGEADGDALVAVTGLAEGDTVVAGSVGPLREGTAVKFTAPPAASAAPAAAAAAASQPGR
jgi:RND family efflux transporter MFP subunit